MTDIACNNDSVNGIEFWESFFDQYKDFSDQREWEKKQGINDFNILTTVLKSTDEVRLHTRYLYALLNPKGLHYQGTLFLEIFMTAIGYKDWLDYKKTRVRKEYSLIDSKDDDQQNQVDLYITDGNRHIIVENKLNAVDQKGQIARYAQTIHDKYDLEHTDLLFVYLNKGREPEGRALKWNNEGYNIDQSHQTLKNKSSGSNICLYISIQYSKEIISWINESIKAINHIESLKFALNDYKVAVDKATKKYMSNIMTLEKFLEGKTPKEENQFYLQAMRAAEELPKLQIRWFKTMVKELKKTMSGYETEGKAIPISVAECPELDSFFYKDKMASLYINKKEKSSYNKGWFWKITTGKFCNKALLCIVYGRYYLHVGLVPIDFIDSDIDCIRINLSKNDDFINKNKSIDLKAYDAMRKKLPNFISNAVNLIEELPALKDFSTSFQANLIKELLKEDGV
ncbi:PD-(D/E)XK nuclease family protein [Desulfovibrio sp. JC022]|uniref:PDDEXK-like family protein n=1 Tax=Desulfovibrio sp. JC022 TaxID=2593642 RepID=UPI0010AAB1E9|nr:PD-(D/E)XK nuclease family protein [Desulfovibrio sp. JC022]NDV24441.1 hypothetical protein [Desulfovibrio sp. JC022]TIH12079.1 hypothetical protein D0S45_19260 [Marinifilum sp. JC120]